MQSACEHASPHAHTLRDLLLERPGWHRHEGAGYRADQASDPQLQQGAWCGLGKLLSVCSLPWPPPQIRIELRESWGPYMLVYRKCTSQHTEHA